LLGGLDGLDLTNRILVAGGSRPLFCRPSERAITAERAEAILDRYLGENPEIGSQKSLPVVDVLMLALEEIYPCRWSAVRPGEGRDPRCRWHKAEQRASARLPSDR
jgi:hypothetical protein